MRVKFTGNQLEEAEVNIVAMVKNGANRMPFKIVKSEDEEMLDLTNAVKGLFVKKDAAVAGPSVAAVMVSKTADLATLLPLLKTAGIDVTTGFAKSEDDNATTYSVADLLKAEGTALVKMSEDVYLAVTGIKKGFEGYDFESTSFKEVMSKGAFVPSICIAQDMMSRTMYNVLEKSTSPKEAAAEITKLTKDFGEYVTMLAKGLPESAFKADAAITKAWKGKEKEGDKDSDDKKMKKDNGDGSGFEASRTSAHGLPGDATGDEADSVANSKKTPNVTVPGLFRKEGETDAEWGARLVKAHAEEQAKLAKAEEAKPMTDAFAKLEKLFTDGLSHLEKKVADQGTALEGKLKAVKEDVTKSLDSVIVGGDALGDKTGEFRKSDNNGVKVPPLLDTAFMKLDMSNAKPLANGKLS